MPKLKVAITGGIASGKTTFCNYLREAKYDVIQADDIAKELMQSNSDIQVQIIENFGSQSFVNGKLNSALLSKIVFSNAKNVLKINEIVHPYVIEELQKLMDNVLREKDIVFVESALVYEAKIQELFDVVVLIVAEEYRRMVRIRHRTNCSEEDALKRIKAQLPDNIKKKEADLTITNNGSLNHLISQLKTLFTFLNKKVQEMER